MRRVTQTQEPEERPDTADESVETATDVAFEDPVFIRLWDRGDRGEAECWWARGRQGGLRGEDTSRDEKECDNGFLHTGGH